MRITPIVQHAAARIPLLTDLFSETITADVNIVANGTMTINCHEPHGLAIGTKHGVCLRGVKIRVPIEGVELAENDYLLINFSNPHYLIDNSSSRYVESWNEKIVLEGFADPLMNGSQEFIGRVSDTSVFIKPLEGASFGFDNNPALVSDGNGVFDGWHPVTVEDETTLSAPANILINFDTYATNITVAKNIRSWGVSDFAAVQQIFSNDNRTLEQPCLFITPLNLVSVSKDRNAKTSAVAELNSNVNMRQMVLDGFHAVAVIPTANAPGYLQALDLCHGEIHSIILKTFQGYKPAYPDLENIETWAAVIKQHSGMVADRAYYVHEWEFECPYTLSNENAISAFEFIQTGQIGTVPEDQIDTIDPATPVGTIPITDLKFDGIYNEDMEQPLTARIDIHED